MNKMKQIIPESVNVRIIVTMLLIICKPFLTSFNPRRAKKNASIVSSKTKYKGWKLKFDTKKCIKLAELLVMKNKRIQHKDNKHDTRLLFIP